MKPEPLTDLEKDALKEVGSIGANHASTSLSKLINRPVKVQMLHLEKMLVKDIVKLVGGPKEESIGTIFRLIGQINGGIFLLSKKQTSIRLAEILLEKEKGSLKQIDMMTRSAIKEMGNILTGSYLASLSDFAGMNIMASTPILMIDNAEKIINKAVPPSNGIEYVLVVQTTLKIEFEDFTEEIILVLKPKVFEKIFESIIKRMGL